MTYVLTVLATMLYLGIGSTLALKFSINLFSFGLCLFFWPLTGVVVTIAFIGVMLSDLKRKIRP